MLAALTAIVGIVIGWGAGAWLAHGMAQLYARFFDFPCLIFRGFWAIYAAAGLIGLASASLGALRVALTAARLPPAVAMQPPPPPQFRRGVTDRLMSRLRLSQPAMMILRSITRWPLRAATSALGLSMAVTATIDQYVGIAAYMDFETLSALRRQALQVSVANLTLDPAQGAEFHRALAGMLALAGTAMVTDMRRSFSETLRRNINITATVYMTIAVLITVGVTCNGARIQLSERARELASLRILGFSRGEVSSILVGEAMVLAVLAQPLGWLAGLAAGDRVILHPSDAVAEGIPVKERTAR